MVSESYDTSKCIFAVLCLVLTARQLLTTYQSLFSSYMLGDCLLDGEGVEMDRGAALEWLIRSADLGHR